MSGYLFSKVTNSCYTKYYTDDVYFSAPSGKVELLMTVPNEEWKMGGKDVSLDCAEFI